VSLLRGYIFARPFMGERVPQHVQNIVLRDYCRRFNHQLLLAATEYAMPDSTLILEGVLQELDDIDGILCYSLFQLPRQRDVRMGVIDRVLSKRKGLHFAVENLAVNDAGAAELVDHYWHVKHATEDGKTPFQQV